MKAIFVSLVCCYAASAMAALQFESTQIAHTADIADTESTAVFSYTNTGSQPVSITSVKSNCGCTVAELSHAVVPPGESGELVAVFTYGERTGDQIKRIRVTTDHAASVATDLIYRVHIPLPVTVAPKVNRWAQGDNTAFTFTVHFSEPERINSNANAWTTLAPNYHITVDDADAGSVKLTVTPKSGIGKGLTTLQLPYTIDGGLERTVVLYLIVS